MAEAEDQLPDGSKGTIIRSGGQHFIVCRLHRYCSLFPESGQYGSGLWACDHIMYDRHFYSFFQLPCIKKKKTGADLFVPDRIPHHRIQFSICEYQKILSRWLCGPDRGRVVVPCNVYMVQSKKDQEPVC